MCSLESPHRGDSNEYTQYTIFNMTKEKHLKSSQICSYGIFSKGIKNEFETAMVNESLEFYCIFDIEANLLCMSNSKEMFQSQYKHVTEYVSENIYILLQLLQYRTTFAPPNDTAIVTIEITFASRYVPAICTADNNICTSICSFDCFNRNTISTFICFCNCYSRKQHLNNNICTSNVPTKLE